MDMEKVIVGPPGYGSPDPRTTAGRLVTLDEHPLKDEIAETDYGSEVTEEEVMESFPPDSVPGTESEGEGAPSAEGKSVEELEDMKKAELVTVAEGQGIDTTGMTKADLVDAITEGQDNPPDEG